MPSLLETALNLKLVLSWTTETAAFGRTAPEASVTRPVIVDVPICADTGAARTNSTTTADARARQRTLEQRIRPPYRGEMSQPVRAEMFHKKLMSDYVRREKCKSSRNSEIGWPQKAKL